MVQDAMGAHGSRMSRGSVSSRSNTSLTPSGGTDSLAVSLAGAAAAHPASLAPGAMFPLAGGPGAASPWHAADSLAKEGPRSMADEGGRQRRTTKEGPRSMADVQAVESPPLASRGVAGAGSGWAPVFTMEPSAGTAAAGGGAAALAHGPDMVSCVGCRCGWQHCTCSGRISRSVAQCGWRCSVRCARCKQACAGRKEGACRFEGYAVGKAQADEARCVSRRSTALAVPASLGVSCAAGVNKRGARWLRPQHRGSGHAAAAPSAGVASLVVVALYPAAPAVADMLNMCHSRPGGLVHIGRCWWRASNVCCG
jgi:hypothetical protein